MVTHDSIRQKVYRIWVENPYTTAKPGCKKLKLDFKKHGNYVKKLLSEFRCYHKFASPQEAHAPHRRVFVWECIERGLPDVRRSLEFWGWREVANRNQMWVYKDDRGSVHWYKNGLVRLYLKGAVQLARAKDLFCRAFSWFSSEQVCKFLDVPLREELRHWVFDVGAPMPRFDIRQFEKSHGLRIFTDGSHPTALEVEETTPLMMVKFEKVIQDLSSTVADLGVQIKEHMKLIKEWRKEANVRRKNNAME